MAGGDGSFQLAKWLESDEELLSLSLSCSRGIVSSGQGDAGRTGARESIGRREAAPCRLFPYVYYAYLITFLLCPNPLPLSLSPLTFFVFICSTFALGPAPLSPKLDAIRVTHWVYSRIDPSLLLVSFWFFYFVSSSSLRRKKEKEEEEDRPALYMWSAGLYWLVLSKSVCIHFTRQRY